MSTATTAKPSTSSSPGGPLEQTIRSRLSAAYAPVLLEIENESHKHRHHVAMRGVDSVETHFRVRIVSQAFAGKPLVQRQRGIYALLKDEMQRDGGIHALALVTKTPEEAGMAEQAAAQKTQ
ncbi:BolA domain UV induced protein Uvi31 [Coemansia interrupta]|uniref:BolA domain UV induced protein Uvi31 n=1 Tax=Coemansia interrupta TaxID=1126814 RepID=A0A9W8LJ49_9FUNG|nr:BolA domain UV induced protein Uvi31 [Coemansia interrupta]